MKIDFQRFIADTAFIWEPYVQKFHEPNRPSKIVVTEISDERVLIRDPFVSIVILTYNHGKMLEECVQSVLMQKTEYSFEIIIANDVSTDCTTDICIRLQREYPERIRVLNGNANVGSIRNAVRGIQRCRGKYIACIDGDDFYLSKYKIQKQVSYLEEHRNVSVCFCSFLQQLNDWSFTRTPIRSKTKKQYVALNSISKEERANLILIRNRLAPICAFFRADSAKFAVRKIVGLFELIEWFPCQDFELWFYMSFTGEIHFIPEDLCVYRVNETSASNDPDEVVACARSFGDACNKLAMIQDVPSFISDESKDFVERLAVCKLVHYLKLVNGINCLTDYLKKVLDTFGYSYKELCTDDKNIIRKISALARYKYLQFRGSAMGYLIRKCLISVFGI